MAKNPTLKQQYMQQRKRIQQFIRRAEKRGFYWEKPVLGNIPKRITRKSVEALKKKDAKSLYKKAKWVDVTTGEFVNPKTNKPYTGTEGRNIERKQSAEKGAETKKRQKKEREFDWNDWQGSNDDSYKPSESEEAPSSWFTWATIANYREDLNKWNDVFANTMKDWLNQLIAEYGEDDVAQMLYEGRQNGLVISPKEAYHAGTAEWYMMEMMHYLPEVGDYTLGKLEETLPQLFYDNGWYDEK